MAVLSLPLPSGLAGLTGPVHFALKRIGIGVLGSELVPMLAVSKLAVRRDMLRIREKA